MHLIPVFFGSILASQSHYFINSSRMVLKILSHIVYLLIEDNPAAFLRFMSFNFLLCNFVCSNYQFLPIFFLCFLLFFINPI